MSRVVAGSAGGRTLRTPPGRATRPTSDRVREAMYSSLESMLGGLDGLAVVDLYAGSGALGLEALSRGAASAVLVEHDRRTSAVIARNVAELGLAGAEVVTAPVRRWVERGPRPEAGRVDLALLDPPYGHDDDDLAAVLAALAADVLAPDAVVVVERSSRDAAPRWPEGVKEVRSRAYGETVLWYGRRTVGPG